MHGRNSRVANDVGELHASNVGRTDDNLPFRTDDSSGHVSGYTGTKYYCIFYILFYIVLLNVVKYSLMNVIIIIFLITEM